MGHCCQEDPPFNHCTTPSLIVVGLQKILNKLPLHNATSETRALFAYLEDLISLLPLLKQTPPFRVANPPPPQVGEPQQTFHICKFRRLESFAQNWIQKLWHVKIKPFKQLTTASQSEEPFMTMVQKICRLSLFSWHMLSARLQPTNI